MSSDVRIGFVGYGAYVPETTLTNEELTHLVDTSDEWIRRRTGIQSRRILNGTETILDMTVGAARKAMLDAGVEAHDIGDIRVGVNTWMRFPSLATQVQKALGATDAAACDVSAGCSGFIYAVEEAYNKIFVERVKYGRALTSLVVGVDALSHITDWSDRGTCVLLGDGAGAVVIREVDAGGILATHTHADGNFGHLLYSETVPVLQAASAAPGPVQQIEKGPPAFLRMEGRKVYAAAVDTMVGEVRRVIEKYNQTSGESIGIGDIDYVFPHQANLRIVEMVAKRLRIPLDKIYTDGIVKYGNTSTASIPLGYCDVRDRFPDRPPGRLEVDVAFGAGFASGAILRRVP